MRPLRLLAWGVALALFAYAIAMYGALPERIPVHLGADGRPDGFADRGWGRWLALPLAYAAVLALFEWLAVLVPRRPELLNVPDKERYAALPPRWRAPADAAVVQLLDATAFGVGAFFLAIQWHFTRLALGGPALPVPAFMLGSMALTVGLLLCVARITGTIDDAHARWVAAGSPAD